MRVVRRMSSRFLSQAMFDSIISNYTTVFLWVCPQNNLRTGLSMSFQGKLTTKTVLRFCWLRLPPPTKRSAFVFPQLIRICFSAITTSKTSGATLQKNRTFALSFFIIKRKNDMECRREKEEQRTL